MGSAGNTAMSAERKGISGSTLKLIAIIAMFIDHVGAIIVERIMMLNSSGGELTGINIHLDYTQLTILDIILRLIGRLGFPIFCFLLIEGFLHTRDVKKYAIRLFLFALISEVPFDLGFCGGPLNMAYQNVFFTLFFGLIVMIAFQWLEQQQGWNKVVRIVTQILVVAIGMIIAELLRTDYGAIGILTIAAMYLYHHNKLLQTALGCMVLTAFNPMEITAFIIMLPVHFYNGRRGWNMKWFFYAFYPIHILLLYLVACAIGLGDVVMR